MQIPEMPVHSPGLFSTSEEDGTFSAAFIAALQFYEKVSGTLQAEVEDHQD
jgi:hypothetical protein